MFMLTSLGADGISAVDPSPVHSDYRMQTTGENAAEEIGIFLKGSPSFAHSASRTGRSSGISLRKQKKIATGLCSYRG
jgi:hypothetical protein